MGRRTSDLRFLCPEPANFSRAGLERARRIVDLTAEELDDDSFASGLPAFDGALVRLSRTITAEMIAAAPGLKVIVSPTTGEDHIALSAAAEHGVHVITLRGERSFLESIHSTAEHTFALLLALTRRVPWAFEDVCEGRWAPSRHRGRDLHGMTLGVVGLGRVGRKVAAYARSFGMHVLAFDPNPPAAEDSRLVDLERLLAESDVISLHAPLTAETAGMLGERELRSCKSGAIVINTARGELVDEAALLECLRAGHLGGGAVDVLVDERRTDPASHPLVAYAREHDNLIVTPHIAGASNEAIEATDLFVLDRLEDWIRSRSAGG